jgi:DedD protein
MAFFKFRKGGDDQAAAAPQPESVEVMRRRAKHRLIGAVVLVLAGVIGFPLLVDKQPRPIAVDIPIEIPDKAKVKPLAAPEPVASAPAVAAPAATPAPAKTAIITETKSDAKAEVKSEPKVEAKAETKPELKPEAKVEAKPVDKAADKTAEKPAAKAPADNGAKALALLEGKEPAKDTAKEAPKEAAKDAAKPAAANGERYIVQVGAFADVTKAREVRLKVERAGLKTYTHVIETSEGKRIRVRVGPFTSKAEADKAADKIKKLDLPAAILTL